MRKPLYLILSALLTCSSTQAAQRSLIELTYNHTSSATYPGIGKCKWTYDGYNFFIIHQGQRYLVQQYYVDKMLRGINKVELIAFLEGGYLFINRLASGEFTLTAKVRLNGGVIFMALGTMVLSLGVEWLKGSFEADVVPVRNQAPRIPDRVPNIPNRVPNVAVPVEVPNQAAPCVKQPSNVPIPMEKIIEKLECIDDQSGPLSRAELIGNGPKVKIRIPAGPFDRVEQGGNGPKVKMRIPAVIPQPGPSANCIVGPGIPIAPIPWLPRPPMRKMPRDIPIQDLPGFPKLA